MDKASIAEIEELLRQRDARRPGPKPRARRPEPIQSAPAAIIQYESENRATAKYAPLEFDNPGEMMDFFIPAFDPHPWQAQEQLKLAGYAGIAAGNVDTKVAPTKEAPMIYSLVAANGSGKDAFIIAPFAVWFCGTKVRSRCIITSSSYEQLKSQTFANIKTYCEYVNEKLGEKFFDIVEFHITCRRTGSEIKCFKTDEAGKAEGFHPHSDWPGAEMAIIVNEAKSIEDSLFTAFMRFTGYNYWLEISSPNTTAGHFYRSCQIATPHPEPLKLGVGHMRRVTAFECPHIPPAHIARVKAIYGESSPLYRTMILAEFVDTDASVIIPDHALEYKAPELKDYGLPKKAGLDLSLGGDETVLSIWLGNKRVAQETWKIAHEPTLCTVLIDAFRRNNLRGENINVDGGGIGKAIIQRLREAGWQVRSVKNDESARNKREFANRGAEFWFKVKRLIEAQKLILPNDPKLLKQLTARRFLPEVLASKGKMQLEPKKIAKARGVDSPDRADAMVLAFANTPLDVFIIGAKDADVIEDKPPTLAEKIRASMATPEEISQYIDLMRQAANKVNYDTNQYAERPRGAIEDFLLNGTPR